MTTTRDELRENVLREDANEHQPDNHGPDRCGDPGCFTSCVVDGCDWPCATAWLLDQLDQAEHRIARLEAQSDIRGRAVVIYRERAREAEAERDWNIRSSRSAKKGRIGANARAESAEARIKAVQDVLDGWQVGGYDALLRRIRRALDGDAQQ